MPVPTAPTSQNASTTEKPPVLQAFSMYGIANQDGIVFSSLNGIIQNPLNSIFGPIFSPPPFTNSNSNANPAPAASATVSNSILAPGQPALTFASIPTSSTGITTLRPSSHIQRPHRPSPSVFSPSASSSTNQYVVTRPENQCGLTNVTKSRVVGGDIAQVGGYQPLLCILTKWSKSQWFYVCSFQDNIRGSQLSDTVSRT